MRLYWSLVFAFCSPLLAKDNDSYGSRPLYKLSANAYPEATQRLVVEISSGKDDGLSKTPVQEANATKYSWEVYRITANLESHELDSEHVGVGLLVEKNHIFIRLDEDKRSFASNPDFLPFVPGNILIFTESGSTNLTSAHFKAAFGKKSQDKNLQKILKFVALPVETGIKKFE